MMVYNDQLLRTMQLFLDEGAFMVLLLRNNAYVSDMVSRDDDKLKVC